MSTPHPPTQITNIAAASVDVCACPSPTDEYGYDRGFSRRDGLVEGIAQFS
jgi:hypothetical protein